MSTLHKRVVSLTSFVTPDSIKEIFADTFSSNKRHTHIVIDFSLLKILDKHSFKAILDTIKIFELSGTKVAIYGVSPHIAIEIATLIPRDLTILRSSDDKF